MNVKYCDIIIKYIKDFSRSLSLQNLSGRKLVSFLMKVGRFLKFHLFPPSLGNGSPQYKKINLELGVIYHYFTPLFGTRNILYVRFKVIWFVFEQVLLHLKIVSKSHFVTKY